MRYFLNAGRLLVLDLASTILFIAVFLLTHSTYLSVGLGMALGLTQIGTQFARRKPIETMEWLSLFLVIAAGAATLLTDDLRYVLFKPSVIYTIVGVVMLKPGGSIAICLPSPRRSSRTSPSYWASYGLA
jgi:intracellular septation protein